VKAVLDSLDGISEALQGEYEQRDGKYVLKIEGDVPGLVTASTLSEANGKLAEFRESNRALNAAKTELDAKLATFEGIDPAEYKAAKDKIAELESKGVKKGDDITKIVQDAVSAAVTPVSEQLEAFKKQASDAQQALARKDLESALQTAGLKAGVEEKALPDYLRRGVEVFGFDGEGKVVAKNGDTPLYSKDCPAEPLGMEEWASGLSTEAPHLFKPSKGGGANPGPGGPVPERTVTPDQFGASLEDIAAGKVTVQ